MKLVGDIGGTKVLLALVDETGAIIQKRRLASADFSSFDELLTEYLRGVSVAVDGGCLAVAGPVADDGRSAKVTNLPWSIDCATLETCFGLGRLALINDFAGVALGVAALPPDQRVTLQRGEAVPNGMKLVIGAGTGLGVAALLGEQILPSEGGHVGFAPVDEIGYRIWQTLLTEHGRVTAERVISGPGLAAIHRILTGETCDPEAIGTRALDGETAARGSTDQFFACYGTFAGDLAMAFMVRDGVYLAGGVTQKLASLLIQSPFLARFNDKAEHTELVKRIPVYLVTEPEIGLIGAARCLLS